MWYSYLYYEQRRLILKKAGAVHSHENYINNLKSTFLFNTYYPYIITHESMQYELHILINTYHNGRKCDNPPLRTPKTINQKISA